MQEYGQTCNSKKWNWLTYTVTGNFVLFNRSQDRIRVKTHIPDISTYKVIMASCIRSIYSTGSIKTYRFMMGNTVPKFTYGCQFSVNI